MSGTRRVVDLREALADRLVRSGMIRSEAVERAFRKVSRHAFLVGEADEVEAYRDQVVELLPGVSTASQPSVVASMLEELDVGQGDRVLEIGTASGYNAALLAEVTGAPGLVYSVELEAALVERARIRLLTAGYGEVHLHRGDGSFGFAEGAPYDRIIVTAAVVDLSGQLLAQLAEDGVLLTPYAVSILPELLLHLHRPAGQASPVFDGCFVGFPVTFVPLRGEYREAGGPMARDSLMGAALALIRERAWVEGWEFDLPSQLGVGLYAASTLARDRPAEPEVLAGHSIDSWLRDGRPQTSQLAVAVTPVGVPPRHVEWLPGRDVNVSFGPRSGKSA